MFIAVLIPSIPWLPLSFEPSALHKKMNSKSINVVESWARELIEPFFSELKKTGHRCSRVIGNVDGLSNRTLQGWVLDEKSKNATVDFSVFHGDIKVGGGKADIFRQDLKDAGFGNGNHGFSVELDLNKFDSTKKYLVLVENKSSEPIKTNDFCIDDRADLVAEVEGITDRRVIAIITDVFGTAADLSVEILVDGSSRLPCAQENQNPGQVRVEAVLPEFVFDGVPHTYEVVVNNANCISSVHIEVLNPITTPEEFLADSIGKDGYPFASKVALQRYQSVIRKLEGCADTTDSKAAIANILVAHQHLESGTKKKANYDRLILPLVANPEVSIIISARNQFSFTYHCIASLVLAQNQASFEVLLVDDQSDDETLFAERYFENVRVIRNKTNQGYLLSNNLAVSEAKGKYVCLLNNDTEVTAGWIDRALEVFSLYENVGAVGCKLIYPDGSLQEAGGLVWKGGVPWNYGKGQNASHPRFNYVRQSDYLSAAALFIDANAWRRVGGFSEAFAPAYYEDTDLAYKLREANYRTVYCPGSTVIHFEGVSNGQDIDSGIKVHQKHNAIRFKSKWNKDFRNNSDEGDRPHLEVDRGSQQRILVIDANTPRLNHDAGSYAAVQEIKLLLELSSKITFLPLNIAHMGMHTEYLQKLGVECLYYPFYVSLEQVLQARGGEFDVVYITRYETVMTTIQMIRKYCGAKVIFNNADLHFMRELREVLRMEDRELSGPLATREKELEAIESVDLTLCYTESERAIITSHVFTEDTIMRCPWVVQPVENSKTFEQRQGIVFLGGFAHKPNVDAIKYFCTDVMSRLNEKLPDLVLHVYGSGMPDEVIELESSNVKIEGFVEDISEIFCDARIFVCPLRTGAGLNGKIIDCIAHGLPSVVSPLTADGTGLVHRQNTMVAECTDEWVDYIYELYSDPQLWSLFSSRVVELSKGLYSGAEGVKRMSNILSRVGIYTDPKEKRLFSGFAE